jgi:hypothetical protein
LFDQSFGHIENYFQKFMFEIVYFALYYQRVKVRLISFDRLYIIIIGEHFQIGERN